MYTEEAKSDMITFTVRHEGTPKQFTMSHDDMFVTLQEMLYREFNLTVDNQLVMSKSNAVPPLTMANGHSTLTECGIRNGVALHLFVMNYV